MTRVHDILSTWKPTPSHGRVHSSLPLLHLLTGTTTLAIPSVPGLHDTCTHALLMPIQHQLCTAAAAEVTSSMQPTRTVLLFSQRGSLFSNWLIISAVHEYLQQ